MAMDKLSVKEYEDPFLDNGKSCECPLWGGKSGDGNRLEPWIR